MVPKKGKCKAKDLTSMTAVILAGGMGTRLRPVVANRPKVLAPVRRRPFLAYLLDQLAAADLKYVVLSTGYMAEQVHAAFGNTYGRLQLVYSQETEPLGTAGALRLTMPLLKSDPVLVMNGDSFCQVNLRNFWVWHCKLGANATMVLAKGSNTAHYGQVDVDRDGFVTRFIEKGGTDTPGWINAGIYLLSHSFILTIPSNGAVSLEREIFPAWIGRGLYGYRNGGHFLDIGTPEAYATAQSFFN